MGDRGYEGDSGYLGHLGTAAGTDRWNTDPRESQPPQGAYAEDAAAGVARRLQGRLDRHLWLLERLQADGLYPEPSGLGELQDTARRMRRDSETMLLLCGHDAGVRTTGPRRLADLLADAATVAEEPRRVDVRSGPAALVAPAAAVEFLHVLAEIVDHVTAAYPGARLELVSRLEGALPGLDRGVTVDVVVDAAALHDPDGPGARRAAAAAEQLAQRSRHGIVLRRPTAGVPPTGSGLVASVHCPTAAVTVEEPVPVPVEPARPSRVNGRGGIGGIGGGIGSVGSTALPSRSNGAARPAVGVNGSASEGLNGAGRTPPSFDESPAYSPSPSSQVDELFGPLLDLPLEPIDDRYATPIFEAIASAWFREDGSDAGAGAGPKRSGAERDPVDWETPQDDEWREAAARAARSEPTPTTATGLPRRRPGNQLVPPPRVTEQQRGGPAERVPDRVRDRLSTYQRGLREGRHRAEGPEAAGPENW